MVVKRLKFLAGGLQTYILEPSQHQIRPLSKEEAKKRTMTGQKTWVMKHPEDAAVIQHLAVLASIEKAQARVYTTEVLELIKQHLESGHSYSETVVLLRDTFDIEVSVRALIHAVREHGIKYVKAENDRSRHQSVLEVARKVFASSLNRRSYCTAMEQLGYGPSEANRALVRQGLRKRVDWTTLVGETSLSNVVQQIMDQYLPNHIAEYNLFRKRITELGYDGPEISIWAYRSQRRRILGKP